MTIKHKFTSPKSDGTDLTHVRPSNWNDDHDIPSDVAMGGHKLVELSVPENAGDSIRVTAKITEALLESATDLKHTAVTLSADAENNLLSLSGQQIALDDQATNYVFAGPYSGAAAAPAFRPLVNADLPSTVETHITGTGAPHTAVGVGAEQANFNIQDHVTGTGNPHTPAGIGAEPANTNIQAHVVGTGSPHTAAGVGAEVAGAVGAHANLATGIHGVGAGTIAKVGDIAVDANLSANAQDAVTKRHSQNTDTDLNPAHKDIATGIHGVGAGTIAKVGDIAVDANLSTNAQDAVTKRHSQNTDSDLNPAHKDSTTGVHGVGGSTIDSVSARASAITSHAAITASVHNFDGSGNAPAQAHNQAASTITSGVLDGDRLPTLSVTKRGGVPATGTPSSKFLRDDDSWAAPTATAADPLYSPGSFIVVTETGHWQPARLKLTGSQRATLEGTSRLAIT